ncbi:MAG: hypothetical protein OQK82_03680 [Candidatus Pacearchaeota archaeon]|nr:hypothetical protein [Candidatus Pacearchaeota archaeon]
MKKILSLVLICSVLLTSCADSLTYVNGQGQSVTAKSTGIFNKEKRDPNVNYELCVGNVVWTVILCETLVMPLYFVGWSIMEPVSVKQQPIFVVPVEPTRQDSLKEQAKLKQQEAFEDVKANVDAATENLFGSNE